MVSPQIPANPKLGTATDQSTDRLCQVSSKFNKRAPAKKTPTAQPQLHGALAAFRHNKPTKTRTYGSAVDFHGAGFGQDISSRLQFKSAREP
jgi:hypothetical protein